MIELIALIAIVIMLIGTALIVYFPLIGVLYVLVVIAVIVYCIVESGRRNQAYLYR